MHTGGFGPQHTHHYFQSNLTKNLDFSVNTEK